MAMPNGSQASPVIRRLMANATGMSFFQLVHELVGAIPGAVPPGYDGPPAAEPLRFRSSTLMGFPPTDMETVEPVEQVEPGGGRHTRYQVTVNFMGVYGPASPLPNHVSEEIIWGEGDGSPARDFLDIFHHRLISFVYRAWEKVRHHVQFDPDGPDRFTWRTLCLVGLGTGGIPEALGFSPLNVLRSAGLFADQRRSAGGLAGALREYFGGIPVEVESCVERQAPIPEDQRIQLGRRSCRLGEDACIGERMWDLGSAFRVSVGPLPADRFRQFLPAGEGFQQLVRLVRLYAPDPLVFDVRLLLRGGEAPPLRLTPQAGLPLGQMSWILPGDRGEEGVIIPTGKHDPLSQAAGG